MRVHHRARSFEGNKNFPLEILRQKQFAEENSFVLKESEPYQLDIFILLTPEI